MASRHSITYRYDFDGHAIEVTRWHVGTAYARNGNVGNPKEYFRWKASVDGEQIGGYFYSRADAYEHARASILGILYYWRPDALSVDCVNVRPWTAVQDEMRANYRGRKSLVDA